MSVMNLAWVVPKTGKPQAQNVHAKDRTRLAREGFIRYKLEWVSDARGTLAADVYAQRPLTSDEIRAGADAIYATRGAGRVRLTDQSGEPVS